MKRIACALASSRLAEATASAFALAIHGGLSLFESHVGGENLMANDDAIF